jgi:LmbE family N-acetylglucosaminyl deacetylase
VAWLYLSPHFDDVALSCGGLVWEQAKAGQKVSIGTICAGEPPPIDLSPFAETLHARWEAGQNAPAYRRVEDINSCQRLGASYYHFTLLDCIYRRHPQTGEFMYTSEQALNGPLHPGDAQVIMDLLEALKQAIPGDVTLVCPLGLGNHVDHQLTRLAVEMLEHTCFYYADFPYVLRDITWIENLQSEGWESRIYPISYEGLRAWQDSIWAHGSQISTFWVDEVEMRQVVSHYMLENGGIRLWKRPSS